MDILGRRDSHEGRRAVLVISVDRHEVRECRNQLIGCERSPPILIDSLRFSSLCRLQFRLVLQNLGGLP